MAARWRRLAGQARAALAGRLGRRLAEDRDIAAIAASGLFDRGFYLARYPDVAASGADPVAHYVRSGAAEGRDPRPDFATNGYRACHPEAQGSNPFAHWIRSGTAPPAARPPAGLDLGHWRVDMSKPSLHAGFQGRIGVFIHLFYDDIADEFARLLAPLPYPFAVYVSTSDRLKKAAIERAFGAHGIAVAVKVLPNQGRDIAPFLLGFADEIRSHEICLRLHSKKSTHHPAEFGSQWRWYLCSELLGDADRVRLAVQTMAAMPDLGVLMAQHWPNIAGWVSIGANLPWMNDLLGRVGLALTADTAIQFPSGSMFWFRSAALEPLLGLNLAWEDFSGCGEADRDAGIAHAIERAILFFSARAGFRWAFLPRRQPFASVDLDAARRAIDASGAFDPVYYRRSNPDVAAAGADPLTHYLTQGWREGRDPSAAFDGRFYARRIALGAGTDVNPLLHWVLQGKAEGLPTRPPEVVPARIAVADIYSAYTRAELGPDYEAEGFPKLPATTIRPIAFYFPQFHPFPDNDRLWGRGFTEWTNTTKAQPMFEGHWQPRLPGELGFYDTRLKPVLVRQIELARQYGIHGFCFHHYFFEGRPVMRAPFDLMLANPDLDIPFCLHWANEPWTLRWDGLSDKTGVLLDQRHSPEDDLAFFADILPALTDRRYITVEGRPLLVVYRPGLFPDIAATVERWRDCARRAGVRELFLAVMQNGFEGPADPRRFGFDAAIEYPPHNLGLAPAPQLVRLYDPDFRGNVFDYRAAVDMALARPRPDYALFRGIMPDWDCTPRRANPDIFVNASSAAYRRWLEGLCRYSEAHLPADRRFIFINAWNEWAEGAYLEPDRRRGYAFLGATARAVYGDGG